MTYDMNEMNKKSRMWRWLAPQLGDHQMYHVMIIVTTPINDDVIRLVDSIKTKLESEEIGLRCHLYSRNELQSDLDNYLDVIQITSKFLCVEVDSNEQDSWPSLPWQHTLILETTPTLKHAHNPSNARLSPVGPHLQILNLTDNIDWWIKLLDFLQIFPSFDLVTNRLCDKRISENGRLLVSLKSHWRFLGRELITDQLPEELLKTEIPEMVYRESVEHLMKGTKFRYHVICYNAPFAVILFSAILGICIVVIPIIENKILVSRTSMRYLHAAVVWLCILFCYTVSVHVFKKQVKGQTNRCLSSINEKLSQYKLLAGVENLGIGDFNKYYLHFIHYDIGPCLECTQEQMVARSEEDHYVVSGSAQLTNNYIQCQSRRKLFSMTGSYVNELLRNRMSPPRHIRHVSDAKCLCQFVADIIQETMII